MSTGPVRNVLAKPGGCELWLADAALHKSVRGHVIHPVTWLGLRGVSLEQ